MPEGWLATVLVEERDDGGMGSLRLKLPNQRSTTRFGASLCTCEFRDEDGVLVSAALHADTNGLPFELDIWKVDFSPLRHIPGEITAVAPLLRIEPPPRR